jgi:hypothetical protein
LGEVKEWVGVGVVSVSGAGCGWCWWEWLMRISWVYSDEEAVAVVVVDLM